MDANTELVKRIIDAARAAAGLPPDAKIDQQIMAEAVGLAVDSLIAAMRKAAGLKL